jgi:hypothetical protein
LREGFVLDILGKRRGESVHIDFYRVPTLRLYKDLMSVSFGESIDLVFYGWAVSWTQAFDSTLEHWRSIKPFLELAMNIVIGICDPAADLSF